MHARTSEEHFHFRRFDKDNDIPRVARLLAGIELVDQAGEDVSEEALTGQLAWPGLDPSRDRWIATECGSEEYITGFGAVWKVPQNTHADIYVGVHPAYRGHGLGSALLERILTRARELQPRDILASVDIQHQEAVNFLRKRAFAWVAAYTQMTLASNTPLPQPTWPTGYTIRAYNSSTDFSLLLAMYNQAFQGLWGHWEVVTTEDLQGILANQERMGIFLLFAPTGEVVGTCRGEVSEQLSTRRGRPTGYLDSPGVVPAYRDKNLYLPLLLQAAHWARQQSLVDLEIESWGDDPQVLARYQEVGFTIIRQQDIYRWQGQ